MNSLPLSPVVISYANLHGIATYSPAGSYRYPWLIRAIQRALALPSLSYTCFVTRQIFTNLFPDSQFLLLILSRPISALRQNVAR